MDESADFGARRLKVKDVQMLRIDHSDVYIENDRLGEDLLHTIDSIHRSRYAKAMSRNTEINELKQDLLAMRTVTNRWTSALNRTRSATSPTQIKGGMNRKIEKTTILNRNNKEKKENLSNEKISGLKSSNAPATFKSIQVRMPPTKTNHDKVEHSDDETHGSDSSSDDYDDDEEDDDDDDDDSVDSDSEMIKPNGHHRRVSSKLSKHASSSTTLTQNQGNNKQKNNKTKLKQKNPVATIMSHLNIDKLPPSWYTEVVPASDVHLPRRRILENKNDLNQTFNPRKHSKSRKHGTTNSKVRPSTCAPDIFKQESKLPIQRENNQNKVQRPTRPFTTAGIRSWGGDNSGEQKLRSKSGKPPRLNRDLGMDRPQSVLFCDQAVLGMKTMRQLKEEEIQASIFNTRTAADIQLEEVRREQKVIDEKVKKFVKSLEDERRSERLKTLMSESTLISSSSLWKLS